MKLACIYECSCVRPSAFAGIVELATGGWNDSISTSASTYERDNLADRLIYDCTTSHEGFPAHEAAVRIRMSR